MVVWQSKMISIFYIEVFFLLEIPRVIRIREIKLQLVEMFHMMISNFYMELFFPREILRDARIREIKLQLVEMFQKSMMISIFYMEVFFSWRFRVLLEFMK